MEENQCAVYTTVTRFSPSYFVTWGSQVEITKAKGGEVGRSTQEKQ